MTIEQTPVRSAHPAGGTQNRRDAPVPRTLPGLAALRARLTGRILTPADAGWAAEYRPWNVAVGAEPVAVLFAATADDVSTIVHYAGEHGFRISPQAGGHGATAALAGTIVVRMVELKDVWIDAAARIAKVDAGVSWGELQFAL